MTKINAGVVKTGMYISAENLKQTIEKLRLEKDWSKRRVCEEAGVPYSWIIDLYRNNPQKPDMKRAEKILQVLQKKEIKPLKMTQTENALFEALQIIIGAQTVKGNFLHTLEEKFNDQIVEFEGNQQQDAADVMARLVDFLHSGLRQQAIPRPQQSQRPLPHQSHEKKNL